MEIIDTREVKKVFFGDIERRQAFIYDDELYIKTSSIYSEDDECYYNCVALEDSYLCSLCDEDEVEIVNLTIRIR